MENYLHKEFLALIQERNALIIKIARKTKQIRQLEQDIQDIEEKNKHDFTIWKQIGMGKEAFLMKTCKKCNKIEKYYKKTGRARNDQEKICSNQLIN
jgi:thymidylate synthase